MWDRVWLPGSPLLVSGVSRTVPVNHGSPQARNGTRPFVNKTVTEHHMGGKLRHILIFLLILLKEPNMPEAVCSCAPSSQCKCNEMGLTSIPENLPTSIKLLNLASNQITTIQKGPNHNVVGGNTAVSVLASDDDHQYDDIDNPGQGQSQANTASTTNTTATVMTSGDDQTGQGQSQANTASTTNTTATVMTSGDDQTGQGQSQANTASTTNTTATVMTSGDDHRYEDIDSNHDQTGQGQSQANTVSNTNSTATVMASGDDQTGQGQYQPLMKSNTTDTVMTSGHTQTGQGQYEANVESLGTGNLSYGTGPTSSQLNTLYKTATVMARGHDQIGQGQSQTTTASNTNTTATVMTRGHDNIGHGQSHANSDESPKVANLSRHEVIAALQPNPMYVDVKTPPKDEASTEMANRHD
ncbi:hypothetical protein Bbelb_057240 [Branchiostoma belcheri]|nr:hypothetical protein Bbelb_057240 [Branchiostoma belcheri]